MGDTTNPADIDCMIAALRSQKPNDYRWLQAKQLRAPADHPPPPAELAAVFDNPANQPGRSKIASLHAGLSQSTLKNPRAIAKALLPAPRVLPQMLQSPRAAPTRIPDYRLIELMTVITDWPGQRQSICESSRFLQAVPWRHSFFWRESRCRNSQEQGYSRHP